MNFKIAWDNRSKGTVQVVNLDLNFRICLITTSTSLWRHMMVLKTIAILEVGLKIRYWSRDILHRFPYYSVWFHIARHQREVCPWQRWCLQRWAKHRWIQRGAERQNESHGTVWDPWKWPTDFGLFFGLVELVVKHCRTIITQVWSLHEARICGCGTSRTICVYIYILYTHVGKRWYAWWYMVIVID